MMHIGAYDDEPASVAQMDAFLRENGYENDFTAERLHHEIYLSAAETRHRPAFLVKPVLTPMASP